MLNEKREGIAFFGFTNVMTRELNATRTAYVGEPYLWSGAISVNIPVTKQIANINADNRHYMELSGENTLAGSITFVSILPAEYGKIMSLTRVEGKGTRFTGKLPVKHFSMSFEQESTNDDRNKIIAYDLYVTNAPPIDATTSPPEGATPKDFVLEVAGFELHYPTANGKDKSVSYDWINSAADPARWAENTETIVFPYELLPDEEPDAEG